MAYFKKQKNGKWLARVSWHDGEKLKQKSKATFKTKVEATRWANSFLNDVYTGKAVIDDISFYDYFVDWFETYKKPRLSKATIARYEIIARLIKEEFGNKKLSKIKRHDYQRFINKFGSTHAPDTVKKTNSIIRACVKSAIIDGKINTDFTQNIELVVNKDKEIKVEYLSLSEIRQLVHYLENNLNPKYTANYMILTAIYTGMRLGEICALTWDDIDFNKHTINIDKSWDYMYNGGFKPTKTESSIRTIRINDLILNKLKELKQNNKEMVFENHQNKIPSSNGVNKQLRYAMKQCDISKANFHFHSLRHSHVALLLYYGIDLYSISKRLGHSDMTTTSKKYAYLIDELKAKSDDHIEGVLNEL